MSSMRNAVQRRNHRERGQPEERQKWGLLEKHKDYSARARDFNAKKTKLKALRQKVLDKNPDEFYFGMMSKRGPSGKSGTVPGERGNQELSQEAVRLLKTQDLGYVRTLRNQVMKEVSRLEQRVAGIKSDGKKIVFVDNEDEQQEKLWRDIDVKAGDDEDEESHHEDTQARNLRRKQEGEANKAEARLMVAQERLKALTQAEEALEMQRARMTKTQSVRGANKQGVKFRIRERKR